jgi:hypothetical protein
MKKNAVFLVLFGIAVYCFAGGGNDKSASPEGGGGYLRA